MTCSKALITNYIYWVCVTSILCQNTLCCLTWVSRESHLVVSVSVLNIWSSTALVRGWGTQQAPELAHHVAQGGVVGAQGQPRDGVRGQTWAWHAFRHWVQHSPGNFWRGAQLCIFCYFFLRWFFLCGHRWWLLSVMMGLVTSEAQGYNALCRTHHLLLRTSDPRSWAVFSVSPVSSLSPLWTWLRLWLYRSLLLLRPVRARSRYRGQGRASDSVPWPGPPPPGAGIWWWEGALASLRLVTE